MRNASGSASSIGVPAVGFALLSARAHLDSHRSLGHTQRVRLWNRAAPSATAPRLARCPSGVGLLATAGPFTAHRDAEAPWFTNSRVGGTSPASRPYRGNALVERFQHARPSKPPFPLHRGAENPACSGGRDRSVACFAAPASPSTPKRIGVRVCRSARHSGSAFTATPKRVGSGIPFGPRPWAQRIGFGRSATSRHFGLQESPTEQLSEAACSWCLGTSERAFSSSWALGPSATQRRACLGAEALRFASHFGAGPSGIAFTAAPKRLGSGFPFRRPPATIGSAVVRNAKDALERDFTSGLTVRGHFAARAETRLARYSHQVGPSGRCRPALPFAAAPKRIGSRLRRSTAPSKRPFRRAEAQRAGVFGSEPSATLGFGRFPPHPTRVGSRLRRSAGHRGNPSNLAFQLLRAWMFTGAPKRSGSRPRCRRSRPGPPRPRRRSVAVGAFPSGRAKKPPPVSDGHRCAKALRIPTRRPTFGPTVAARPAIPASAPKHLGGDRRLDKDHGASCRLAVSFSSAQRRVGFRLRRLRAQPGPLSQTPERMEKACHQAVPFGGRLGSTGFRGTEAPRIPASPWAPTSQLCASESVALLEKSSAAVDSSARSARWARALRGSATPRIARDFLGPRPDWSLVPDSSPGKRRVR